METFLSLLYGDRPHGTKICCFSTGKDHNNKRNRTKFCTTLTEFANYASSTSVDREVYIGLCVLDANYLPPGQAARGKYRDMLAAGFYALDLDVGKDPKYPPTREDAFALLEEALPGMPPTLVIQSGATGLHCYWKFPRWVLFACDNDRDNMQKRWQAFQARLKTVAAKHGWTLDSTHDLTRVLRPPGTFNHKDNGHVPVVILEHDPTRRYDPDAFGLDWELEQVVVKEHGKYDVTVPTRIPPLPTKVEVLMTNKHRVKLALEGKLADLKDPSMSAQDMSLAAMLTRAGCTPQEIVTALVAALALRGQGDADMKAPGYYVRTMETAMQWLDEQRKEAETPDGARAKLLQLLGLDIIRIEQCMEDEPSYEVFCADGTSFTLPSSNCLFRCDNFQKRCMEVLRRVIHIGKGDWNTVQQGLLTMCVLVSDDAVRERMRGWLYDHWLSMDSIDADNLPGTQTLGDILHHGTPFVEGGKLFVHVPSLLKFVLREGNQQGLQPPQLIARLRKLDYTNTVRSYVYNGVHSTKSYWTGNIPW